ncbi:TPA: hypothetical protein ACH3X1_016400 [Trebouxia sp. C0004]
MSYLDIDVQVDHDDKENTSLHAFNKLWQSEFAQDCLLVFSTGRSLKLYNELRSESEQRPHKLSYTVSVKGDAAEKVVSQLEDKLQAAGVTAKVIYSGGADLDILPQHASKGKGLEFLLGEVKELVGVPQDGVLVNGDSGNDIELFAVPGVRGCMVVNAHPELKKWCDAHPSSNLFQASKRCAGGIVEALQHFKLAKHT